MKKNAFRSQQRVGAHLLLAERQKAGRVSSQVMGFFPFGKMKNPAVLHDTVVKTLCLFLVEIFALFYCIPFIINVL